MTTEIGRGHKECHKMILVQAISTAINSRGIYTTNSICTILPKLCT